MSALTDRVERMSQETERAILIRLGKEAVYYRDEHARSMVALLGEPDESQRIETWAELHIQWGMRIRVYAEVAVKLELFKTKEEYLEALRPERKTEMNGTHYT